MTDSYAFISYQTDDKHIAGQIKIALERIGINAFLAHEDIEVSEEWRIKILEEIKTADIFICLLSKNYIASQWCTQEAGIAAFRTDMTVIPLSLDGTTPPAFLSNIQSAKIDPNSFEIKAIIPAFIKISFSKGIAITIQMIRSSPNYRRAEENFRLILPHLDKLSLQQGHALLEGAMQNDQVYDAGACAKQYIPQVLRLFGNTLDESERKWLEEVCRRYGAMI
ncbi:toll/interleukin-1 receptor domain-containing protein [Thiospirillum jenense]|uniref:Toll/interleukin-1 receptor domain-containing protein n=2 Tax=Thiospirillum jenense TaxID=1653858 RepID=A0A839HQ54_9GAMM|nr:toll/interleukin-1 receptor domain-containing protein [Thiospirillum jenense]